MAQPTIITYVSGLSATGVVFVGYMIGIVALIKYFREKKKLLPYLSILGFCCGTFYLDIALSFFTILITGENQIPVIISGWIAFGTAPIAIFVMLYMSFDIFKPEWKKAVLIIIGISAVFYWILLFGFPDFMLGGFVDEENLLVKHEAKLPLFIFAGIYTFGNLIISGGGFYRMSKHSEGQIRLRCRQLVIGFIIFSICNSLDMIVPVGIILIPIRIGIAISYLFIYQGFLIRKE